MDSLFSIPLAVNYSPETESLLRDGQVQLNLYKLPDWPDLVSQVGPTFPTYVHFTLAAGLGKLVESDWSLIRHLQAQTQTQCVNLHLVAPASLDPADARQVEAALCQAEADVRLAVELSGTGQVIVENVPIRSEGEEYLRPVVTPAAICRVVRNTGCGLLLDLAHARLAAAVLGMPERDYLAALPVEHLRELHITGVGPHNGEMIDHLAMQAEDWELLDWSLEQIRAGHWAMPALAAFEYGGLGEVFRWRSDRQVLAEQIPQIYRRLQGFTHPPAG